MARLVLIICAIGVVWLVLRRALAGRKRPANRSDAASFAPTARCTRCGAYVDRQLMRPDDDGFCCKEHDAEDR